MMDPQHTPQHDELQKKQALEEHEVQEVLGFLILRFYQQRNESLHAKGQPSQYCHHRSENHLCVWLGKIEAIPSGIRRNHRGFHCFDFLPEVKY